MGIKYASQIVPDERRLQVAITRAIASCIEDAKTQPKEYREFSRLLRMNPVFYKFVDRAVESAADAAEGLTKVQAGLDFNDAMDKCIAGALTRIFMAGMTLGMDLTNALVLASLRGGATVSEEERIALRAVTEDVCGRMGKHKPLAEDTSLDAYLERTAKELFPDDDDSDPIMDAEVPPELKAMMESMREKLPPGADIADIKAIPMSAADFQTFAKAAEAKSHSSCGCRSAFLKIASPESMEQAVSANAEHFPSAVADAIHERAAALGLKGVVGAADVAKAGDNGRGELALALARQPGLQNMADSVSGTVISMHLHGGSVTRDDTVQVMASFLGSILAYAMTDMVSTSEAKH